MYGAILGDLAGSRVEFDNNTDPAFKFWTNKDFITDDTVMTIAVADALLNGRSFEQALRGYFRLYPNLSYGNHFRIWAQTGQLVIPSKGNGAPMRVSPVAYAAKDEAEVIKLATEATIPSHPHPEGVKAAVTVALLIYRARHGASKAQLFKGLKGLGDEWARLKKVSALRENPKWEALAIPSVRQALSCIKEADSFEETIRNSVSIGSDADTIAAIAGSIAEPLYGIPDKQIAFARSKLNDKMRAVLDACYRAWA